MTEAEAKADLIKAMKATVRSRFIANKRFETLDLRLTWLIALASSYITILTILPYIMSSPKCLSDILNFLTVAFSIIVVSVSLLQYSSQNSLKAEQFHRSALEINELRRELEIGDPSKHTFQAIDEFNSRYSAVLQKYSINHDTIDFQSMMVERAHDFPWLTKWGIIKIGFRSFFKSSMPLFLSWSLSLLTLFLIGVAIWSPSRICASPVVSSDRPASICGNAP